MTRSRVIVAAGAAVLAVVAGPGGAAPGRAAGTCRGAAVTILGTEGADRSEGTGGPDVIRGLGGDDVISGLGGDDTICGDSGSDRLDGGAGDDICDGGAGGDSATACEREVSIP